MKTKTATVDASELNRHLGNLASMPNWTITCNRNMARALVSSGQVFCLGVLKDIQAKNMGVGVYRVTAV